MTLDRTGERLDESPAPLNPPHSPDCRSGWLGNDIDGRPVPCLICKPHLRAGTMR